jgi:hypothetical protein
MSVSINGTNGLVFNDASTQNTAATGFGFKNRIINGSMAIDQRNAGASVTASTTSAVYPVDRFQALASDGTGTFTLQQSTTAPSGFNNSIVATVGTTYNPSGSNQYNIRHNIEGLNVPDLGWGASGAATVTLSFWVRSSITGTYGGSLSNSAFDRSYPFTFAISAANTWEQKSITVSGDTSGTWLKTNGTGIRLCISLGAGSTLQGTAGSWASGAYTSATGATNWISNSGATFYITGVQLEKGSTATSFDYRPYGAELALCQRYCWSWSANSGYSWFAMGSWITTTRVLALAKFPVPMRSMPSATYPAPSTLAVTNVAGSAVPVVAVSNSWFNSEYAGISVDVSSATGIAGQSSFLGANNTPTSIVFSAEL